VKKIIIAFGLFLFAAPGYSGQSVLSLDGVQSILLSPNGKHFALLKRQAEKDELFVVNVEEVGSLPGTLSTHHDESTQSHGWMIFAWPCSLGRISSITNARSKRGAMSLWR
jgi:hypothetical protein